MTVEASPLRAVLAELSAGTRTLHDLARRTGLDRDLVEAMVEQLVRLGRVRSSTLSPSCQVTRCRGCPSGGGQEGSLITVERVCVVQASASR